MSDLQLTEAVKAGDPATAKALIESGADIHERSEQEWTPLNWAAGRGDVEMIKLLLEEGADVFEVGRDQRTPYQIALAAARIEAVKLLRKAEAKVEPERKKIYPERPYCKAYYLKELRRFPQWRESRINWKEKTDFDSEEEEGSEKEFADSDVVFIHQDFTVTESMWHNENVIFNQVTPEWRVFCADMLQFKVPDDLDLIPKENPVNTGESI